MADENFGTAGDPQPMLYRAIELTKKIAVPTAALAFVGWIGETGADGGFIKDIWSGLKTASPTLAMIIFVLLMDERRERREAQRQTNERTIDFVNATNSATTALNQMATNFKEKRNGKGRAR